MGEVIKGGAPDRRAVSRLLADRGDLLVVTGLGSASYDVMAPGDHDAKLLSLGRHGQRRDGRPSRHRAARPFRPGPDGRRRDADGLRRAGRLSRCASPPTSRSRSSTTAISARPGCRRAMPAGASSLTGVAATCGFGWTAEITDMAGVEDLRTRVHARGGLKLATVKIMAENLPRALPLRDGVYVKNRFRAAIGHAPIQRDSTAVIEPARLAGTDRKGPLWVREEIGR